MEWNYETTRIPTRIPHRFLYSIFLKHTPQIPNHIFSPTQLIFTIFRISTFPAQSSSHTTRMLIHFISLREVMSVERKKKYPGSCLWGSYGSTSGTKTATISSVCGITVDATLTWATSEGEMKSFEEEISGVACRWNLQRRLPPQQQRKQRRIENRSRRSIVARRPSTHSSRRRWWDWGARDPGAAKHLGGGGRVPIMCVECTWWWVNDRSTVSFCSSTAMMRLWGAAQNPGQGRDRSIWEEGSDYECVNVEWWWERLLNETELEIDVEAGNEKL